VLLPGCGSSNNGKPIPASQSSRLITNIQAADQYSQSGLCTRAHTKVRDARFVLGQVPTSVSSSVRQGISDGLARLDSLISSQCQAPQKTQTDTTPTDTTPTESQTTPTTTSQTQTTQTETTPTQTQPTSTTTVPTGTVPTGTTTTGNGGTPPGGTSTTP
jgi:hypothetical protein